MGEVLGIDKVVAKSDQVMESRGNRRVGRGRQDGGEGTRIEAHKGIKWGGFCSGVSTGVVGEFREGEEFGPIVLMHRGVGAEVLFEFLVNTFGLTVRLRM